MQRDELLAALEAEEEAESLGWLIDRTGSTDAQRLKYRSLKDNARNLRRAAIARAEEEKA